MVSNIDYRTLLNSAKIYATDEIELSPIVIKIDDSVIATLGNFSVTIGKAKSRKTYNTAAIAASALVNKFVIGYSSSFPINKGKILYFDTEQSTYHCKKNLVRILELAGLRTSIHPDNIDFICLRKFDPILRINLIEQAIKITSNLGLVIIDGIRDLVFDINSPKESTDITTKLMQWTEEFEIHVNVVLHTNKTDDNARGHIGTELLNKAETVLQVTKDAKHPEISTVKPVTIRDKEFNEFAFRIGQDGLPEIEDRLEFSPVTNKFDYFEIPEGIHRQALEKTFKDVNNFGYDELINKLKSSYESLGYFAGIGKIKDLKVFCENKRMIFKSAKRYYYNPAFHF